MGWHVNASDAQGRRLADHGAARRGADAVGDIGGVGRDAVHELDVVDVEAALVLHHDGVEQLVAGYQVAAVDVFYALDGHALGPATDNDVGGLVAWLRCVAVGGLSLGVVVDGALVGEDGADSDAAVDGDVEGDGDAAASGHVAGALDAVGDGIV